MRIKLFKHSIDSLFWTICFIILALPLHASNSILSYFSITGTITLFHIVIFFIVLLIMFLSKGKFILNASFLFTVFFGIAIFFGIINGIIGGNSINSILGDSSMYMLAFSIIFIIQSKFIQKKSLNELLDLLYKATFFSCALSIIMFLTKSFSLWGLFSFNDGRYFGGYLSLLIISVPYIYYRFIFIKDISLHKVIIYMTLAFYCMILAQSRTTILATFVGIMVIFLIGVKKMRKRQFIVQLIVMLFTVVIIIGFLNSNFSVVERLLSTNIGNENETTSARLYLYQYYIPLIKGDFMGTGFGEMMYFITQNMVIRLSTATYTVDCAFLTAGFKGGWMMLMIFFLGFVIPLIRSIKIYLKHKDILYMIFIILFILYVFSTAIITGQIIHTIGTLTFFWIIVAFNLKKV